MMHLGRFQMMKMRMSAPACVLVTLVNSPLLLGSGSILVSLMTTIQLRQQGSRRLLSTGMIRMRKNIEMMLQEGRKAALVGQLALVEAEVVGYMPPANDSHGYINIDEFVQHIRSRTSRYLYSI